MRLRSSVTSALAALLLAACETSGGGATPDAAEASRIGYPSVDAALAAVKARPGITESQSDGWTVYEDKSRNETWLFSPAGHAAHPAVVKRTSIRTVDGTRVQTAALCGTSQAECNKLIAEFQAADKKNADQSRQTGQPAIPSGAGSRGGSRY